jgi:hypothetical protein
MYALIDEYISHYGEFGYTGRLMDEFTATSNTPHVAEISGNAINSGIDSRTLKK